MKDSRNDIIINIIPKEQVEGKITPDFIYNRLDLEKNKYECFECIKDDMRYYVVVKINSKEAFMGVWLMNIPRDVTVAIAKYIFAKYRNVRKVRYMFGKNPIGLIRKVNHYRIQLPKTSNELENRLSSKGRYNSKREKRILQETYGEFKVQEFSGEDINYEVVKKFFELKKITHGRDYGMSPEQYIREYHVSNIYALEVDGEVVSIVLSCEQCNNVYLENITYDLRYQKYAVGKILYSIYLERLIEKGKEGIFLAGGTSEYKKRYGSIEEKVFHCEIYRNRMIEKVHGISRFVRERILART